MQGVEIKVDLLALLLIGLDVVLGVQWLDGLGKLVSNYKNGVMEFQWGDGVVKLTSRAGEPPQEASLKTIE